MAKVGRPQKKIEDVLPENWKEIIFDWSCQGWSETEIRAGLSSPKGKFHEGLWYALQEREEEFSQAIKIAKTLRQAWWERQGRENLKADKFQTGLWYACMKNMFGYRDKIEVQEDDSTKEQELGILELPKNGIGKERFARFINQ